jgi:hypothetical protein
MNNNNNKNKHKYSFFDIGFLRKCKYLFLLVCWYLRFIVFKYLFFLILNILKLTFDFRNESSLAFFLVSCFKQIYFHLNIFNEGSFFVRFKNFLFYHCDFSKTDSFVFLMINFIKTCYQRVVDFLNNDKNFVIIAIDNFSLKIKGFLTSNPITTFKNKLRTFSEIIEKTWVDNSHVVAGLWNYKRNLIRSFAKEDYNLKTKFTVFGQIKDSGYNKLHNDYHTLFFVSLKKGMTIWEYVFWVIGSLYFYNFCLISVIVFRYIYLVCVKIVFNLFFLPILKILFNVLFFIIYYFLQIKWFISRVFSAILPILIIPFQKIVQLLTPLISYDRSVLFGFKKNMWLAEQRSLGNLDVTDEDYYEVDWTHDTFESRGGNLAWHLKRRHVELGFGTRPEYKRIDEQWFCHLTYNKKQRMQEEYGRCYLPSDNTIMVSFRGNHRENFHEIKGSFYKYYACYQELARFIYPISDIESNYDYFVLKRRERYLIDPYKQRKYINPNIWIKKEDKDSLFLFDPFKSTPSWYKDKYEYKIFDMYSWLKQIEYDPETNLPNYSAEFTKQLPKDPWLGRQYQVKLLGSERLTTPTSDFRFYSQMRTDKTLDPLLYSNVTNWYFRPIAPDQKRVLIELYLQGVYDFFYDEWVWEYKRHPWILFQAILVTLIWFFDHDVSFLGLDTGEWFYEPEWWLDSFTPIYELGSWYWNWQTEVYYHDDLRRWYMKMKRKYLWWYYEYLSPSVREQRRLVKMKQEQELQRLKELEQKRIAELTKYDPFALEKKYNVEIDETPMVDPYLDPTYVDSDESGNDRTNIFKRKK